VFGFAAAVGIAATTYFECSAWSMMIKIDMLF
jgi:hypothetical protein